MTTISSAQTGIVLDHCFLDHHPQNIPEQPSRILAIESAISLSGVLPHLHRVPVRMASETELSRNHSVGYLRRFADACRGEADFLDTSDTGISRSSYEVASKAAGSVLNSVDAVMAGNIRNAFCAIRPPGHHAEYGNSTGFCYINHVAVAARHLIEKHGLQRVLIIDWDLHHGNGAQNSFISDPKVMVCNTNGHPDQLLYPPKIGYRHEIGQGAGEQFNLNVPLLRGTTDSQYRRAFAENILPAAYGFDPQFVIISAGYDTHKADPFNFMKLETETYGWLTREVKQLAASCCEGRLVLCLEGGYNTNVLGDCVLESIKALIE